MVLYANIVVEIPYSSSANVSTLANKQVSFGYTAFIQLAIFIIHLLDCCEIKCVPVDIRGCQVSLHRTFCVWSIQCLTSIMIEYVSQLNFTPSIRQLSILRVITSNFCLGIDALEEFSSWLVAWVLWNELAVNSEIEDFRLGLWYQFYQIATTCVKFINIIR